MTPAPYRKEFRFAPSMASPAWLAGAEGRKVAATVISFQTPSGGWSKHIDLMGRPRKPGESFYSENDGWHYIATLDNDSTTEEIRFLAAAQRGDRRRGDARRLRARAGLPVGRAIPQRLLAAGLSTTGRLPRRDHLQRRRDRQRDAPARRRRRRALRGRHAGAGATRGRRRRARHRPASSPPRCRTAVCARSGASRAIR